MSVLKFKKVSSDAFVPVRATPLSAGLDLFSPLDFTIAPQSKLIINTGLQVEIPGGSFLKIEARSSLALNYSILCGGKFRHE